MFLGNNKLGEPATLGQRLQDVSGAREEAAERQSFIDGLIHIGHSFLEILLLGVSHREAVHRFKVFGMLY